ncbi:tetratricopeptide repeat protein [Winogradskyella arenosi]|uniref:Tetratricopeptide repeat protein n=2 Tax=Winogradskyella arenosi TaxID=533325 RepID=A0A368ZG05_9FLAO|nr:tetratricopeptide repeat protein [Winogradskyella arenosi]
MTQGEVKEDRRRFIHMFYTNKVTLDWMRYCCLLLLVVFCGKSHVYAQNKPKEIAKFLERSKTLAQTQIDSSFLYVDKALKIAATLENDTLLAQGRLQKSGLYILKNDFSKSEALLQKMMAAPLSKRFKGLALHNLGTIQYYKQNFEAALSLFMQAAELLEQAEIPQKLVSTYSNIGAINATLKNLKNAQVYFERALELSDFNAGIKLQVLVNLSSVYYSKKEYSKYLKRIFEAEELALELQATKVLATIYTNLSLYYSTEAKDYAKAIYYGEKALRLKKASNKINTLSKTYNNIGYAYLKKKEFSTAIRYLDSALVGAEINLKPHIYNNLKASHQGLQQNEKALYYADLKDEIKDSIVEAHQKEKVAELTEKYESEKKARRITVLDTENKLQALTIAQQHNLLLALGLFAVLIAVLGYFGFKNYKIKQQLDKVLLQQRLRKTQLNPHFLFNALQSIQNFIQQNDKEKSKTYLTSYAKLIRLVLEKSDEDFISVEDDKMALESYLNLQLLNYNKAFTYSIDVADSVTEDFDLLPTLITQPFVENAILHGLNSDHEGHIEIAYYKKENVLYVSISDNGKGFKVKEDEARRLHKSMSMAIIREQLKNLNRSSKGFKGTISVNSGTEGTKVILSFKTIEI